MNAQQGSGQNPGQRSKQFCSVCKEWLEMEVVPTGDGDDDGVVWYRCPQCQGFLPKLKSAEETQQPEEIIDSGAAAGENSSAAALDEDLPYDSPAEMMAAQRAAAGAAPAEETEPDAEDPVAGGDDVLLGAAPPDLDAVNEADLPDSGEDAEDESAQATEAEKEPKEEAEPIAEYAAQLAAALEVLPADATGGSPYRPWETYEVGQCIQHLAWQDCGIVVGKEILPGNRRVIKAYFQEAGVVRLIEQAPK